MVKAKRFVLVKQFEGEPKRSDLKLVEEELPAIQDGEFLVQAEYLSVDPYMRAYITSLPTGTTMFGAQISKIIESKNPEYPIGKRVMGFMGWRTHAIVNLNKLHELLPVMLKPVVLSDFTDLPISLVLGVIGWPGNSVAYFGLLEVCEPKKGEILVVSAAAGAVGSHVGQLGKSLGLTVIGIAGTDEKCKWLKNELGFDYTINYKKENLEVALKKAAPDGVDCYFDNVGGVISNTVIHQMKIKGRVSVCGCISTYNTDVKKLPKTTPYEPAIVFKEMKMEGYHASRWLDRSPEAVENAIKMIRSGKLKYRETVTEGFENMFDAFVGMLRGDNIGKSVVKV